MRAGATGYRKGNGIWFGRDTDGVNKIFVGDENGNLLAYDGTTLTVIGNITLQAGAVGEDELADGAVTEDKIGDAAVSEGKLTADAVTAGKISAGAVTTDKLDADAVTADKIAADAVTTDKLDASAVTADKIAADAVTADKISAGAVTTDKLDALAVTSAKIAADAVTADKIDVTDLSAVSASILGALSIGTSGSLGSGQTAYNTGTGFWLEYNAGTPRFSFGNSAGNRVTWDGSSLTIIGTLTGSSVSNLGSLSANLGTITAASVTLGSNGYVKQGQSAYDTGTGFWLGDVSGTPKFSIGNASANKLTWDGSALTVNGVIKGSFTSTSAAVVTLTTASFTGFSSDPVIGISAVQLGPLSSLGIVSAGAITGTSNSTSFTMTLNETASNGLFTLRSLPFVAVDNGNDVLAFAELGISGNTLTFYKFTGTSFSATGWTSSGAKGFKNESSIVLYYPSYIWA
ncbi:MAG TPA: hypothetical protein VFO94_00030 [Gammaproteobacteria bacterium]|nr:hypothetical protein [Gammaproteobacteria bacterium]